MTDVIEVKPVGQYFTECELDQLLRRLVRGNGYHKLSLRGITSWTSKAHSRWVKLSLAHHVAMMLGTRYVVVKMMRSYTNMFFLNDLNIARHLCPDEIVMKRKCRIYEVQESALRKIR